jgi:hypothetical protein
MLRESLIALLLISGIASAEPNQTKAIGNIESVVKSEPSPLEKKIAKVREKYLQERKFEKEDYYDALYTWKYFDWDKAENIAYELVQSSAITNTQKEKELFIRSCRKYPFIKFYSQKTNPKVDPRLAFWVALTESHLKYIKGDHGEIGDMQIMPSLKRDYEDNWKKDDYWIEGFDVKHTINNYIAGIQHLSAAVDNALCSGIPLNKLKAKQLLSIYSYYSRNKKQFEPDDDPPYNLEAEAKMHFYMFDLIDKYSSKGNLINEKGRKLLENKSPKRIVIGKLE